MLKGAVVVLVDAVNPKIMMRRRKAKAAPVQINKPRSSI